jgi:hypothetical protein
MTEEFQDESGQFVKVAYANDEVEAAMIQGLLEDDGIPSVLQALSVDGPRLGFGTLMRSPQRVMVNASQAKEARALLAETLALDEQEALPEPVNARFLEAAHGRKPRNYSFVGGYARIYLWSFGIIAAVFAIFMLLHA